MKILFFSLVAVGLLSCSKEDHNSPADLLLRYNWYEYKNTFTMLTRNGDTVLNVNEQLADSCTRSLYYTFRNNHVVTRQLACLHMGTTEANGTWSLESDTLITVIIPFQGLNFGFHSQNWASVLISINDVEMQTKFSRYFIIFSNGIAKEVTEEAVTLYRHN